MAKIKSEFVHLHNHSEYSLLDGASRVEDIVRRVKELGMKAVALTDHGNMYATVEFYRAAKRQGIKPIIGCEVYVAPRRRGDKEVKEDRSPYHLTLLAKNEEGYKNLLKLVTAGYLEGFYFRPRIDREILEKYHRGIIVLSGCHVGEIPTAILNGEYERAKKVATELKEIFAEDFYLEVQNLGIPEQRLVNEGLVRLSRDIGVKLVATNDTHYVRREDAKAQDVMLCIQTGKYLDDTARMKFPTEEFYLKSPQEMKEAFPELPEALTNTLEVAAKCDLHLELGKVHLPDFPVPEGDTSDSYLEKLCWQGIEKLYGPRAGSNEIIDRVKYELRTIEQMEYAPYFLIVQDFINHARSCGIQVGPGRGSAAGSIVSYALGITRVDPLKYNLIFERFLNPERLTLPDIDVDFCFERRGEVIDYVCQKYGVDHVAQIITFGTMMARAAVRDVGRVQRVPLAQVDKVAKSVPFGPGMTIEKALKSNKELYKIYEEDPKIKDLLETAKTLEGLVRHASMHAAGVVISEKPLTEYAPLQNMNESQVVTQYSMGSLEQIGLLKMDFLGLRNLTMIDHAVSQINASGAEKIEIEKIPPHDKKTFDLLCRGETVGVFQLESRGMRDLIKRLQPETFEDIIALLALYRPGPLESGMVDDFIGRKHGRIPIAYDLPQLETILKGTYGVILYQEQVMQIASQIAGYSLGQADVLRGAMGKKKAKEMAEQKEKFIAGAITNGVPQHKAIWLFNLCSKFAGYGFNKSHSTSYAVISYQTSYLKANYPFEFMCALLTSVSGVVDKVSLYINECRHMKIKILPPDINESLKDFSVSQRAIRFGLAAVKNVGIGAVEDIIKNRQADGPFTSLLGFCRRVDLRAVNKKVIESLIKGGAFDSFKIGRAKLLKNLSKIMEKAQISRRGAAADQTVLFTLQKKEEVEEDIFTEEAKEFSPQELLRMEKEMIGLYITDHPLSYIREALESRVNTRAVEIADKRDGAPVVVGGILAACRKITTRRRQLMMTAVLEDLSGATNVIAFPSTYEKYGPFMGNDNIVIIKGRVDTRNDEIKVVAEEIEPLESGRSLHIELKEGERFESLAGLKEVLATHRGSEPVYFRLNGATVLADKQYWVDINPQLVARLEEVVGEGGVRVDLVNVD